MAAAPAAASRGPLTWAVEDALPETEGEALKVDWHGFSSVQEMREWCEGNAECCGFALHPATEDVKSWGFYPKKCGTGFEAGCAKWRSRKHGSVEKWQFHYVKERSGPQESSALPVFLEDLQPLDFRLSKQISEYGRGDIDDTPKASDVVVYRILEMSLDGRRVPAVPGETRQVTLGKGDVCEALEFGLLRMRAGERARLRAPWAMLSAKPPPPAEAAAALVEGGAQVAELVVELVSFECGVETSILEALDIADYCNTSEQEGRERRIQQVERLLECAKAAKEVGTQLFRAQRHVLALARYLSVCELLLMLDLDSKVELDPMMSLMGMRENHIKEGQQFLRRVLGEGITSEAKAVLQAARLNSAQCWLKLHQWAKAATACDEVLKSDNSTVKAHYRRAQAKLALGDHAAARGSLQELLRLEPDSGATKKLLIEATQKAKAESTLDKQRLKKAVQVAAEGGALDSSERSRPRGKGEKKGSPSAQATGAGGDVPVCRECNDEEQHVEDGEEDSDGSEAALGNLGMLGMGGDGYDPGMSPLDLAKRMGNREVVDVMETHMSKKRLEDIMEEYGASRQEAEEIRDHGGL